MDITLQEKPIEDDHLDRLTQSLRAAKNQEGTKKAAQPKKAAAAPPARPKPDRKAPAVEHLSPEEKAALDKQGDAEDIPF